MQPKSWTIVQQGSFLIFRICTCCFAGEMQVGLNLC